MAEPRRYPVHCDRTHGTASRACPVERDSSPSAAGFTHPKGSVQETPHAAPPVAAHGTRRTIRTSFPTLPSTSTRRAANKVSPDCSASSRPSEGAVQNWRVCGTTSSLAKAKLPRALSVHAVALVVCKSKRQAKSLMASVIACEGPKSIGFTPGTPPIGSGSGPMSHTAGLPLPRGRFATI